MFGDPNTLKMFGCKLLYSKEEFTPNDLAQSNEHRLQWLENQKDNSGKR